MEQKIKPSDQCRAGGLESLSELSRISGVSIQTLNNWSKNKQKLFEVVIAGAVKLKSLAC